MFKIQGAKDQKKEGLFIARDENSITLQMKTTKTRRSCCPGPGMQEVLQRPHLELTPIYRA
jgi:hypothetical protein